MQSVEPDFVSCLKEWGYTRDPFIERYPIEENFWVGPRGKLDHLKFLLKTAIHEEGVLNILFMGEYGSGKTYLLRTLQKYIQSDLKGLGLYFEIPWRSQLRGFRDLHESVVREIGTETIRAVGQKIRTQLNIDKVDSFLDHLLKGDVGIPPDLARAISNIVFEQEVALSWTWLQTNATVYQERALGFTSNPRDETVGVDILFGLFNYLGIAYPIVVLLVDELENLVGESAAIRSIRSGFRNLYERILYGKHVSKFAQFSAASATAMFQMEYTLGRAVLDRVDENIDFAPMSVEDSKSFIRELEDNCKLNPNTRSLFEDENALLDFISRAQTTSVLPASARTGGPRTPRRLIKAGKLLLKYACEESSYPLNSAFIAKHLT